MFAGSCSYSHVSAIDVVFAPVVIVTDVIFRTVEYYDSFSATKQYVNTLICNVI